MVPELSAKADSGSWDACSCLAGPPAHLQGVQVTLCILRCKRELSWMILRLVLLSWSCSHSPPL